jgi:hypothetical protein
MRVKTAYTSLSIIISAVFALVSCSTGSHYVNEVGAKKGTTLTLSSLHYYRGGWFPPPSGVNWADDMTIDFSKPEFPIAGKTSDPSCVKAGKLSQAQATEIVNLISELTLLTSTGPTMVDGGIETIDIVAEGGATFKYHLKIGEVPKDELYATNGQSLSSYLIALEDSLINPCP